MSIIAAALPLVGGVLDGKTSGVFAKQFRKDSKHDKSDCLLGHDVRPASSIYSQSSVGRGIKGWAQSRLLSVRDKISSIRLHRRQSYIACLTDSRLTPSASSCTASPSRGGGHSGAGADCSGTGSDSLVSYVQQGQMQRPACRRLECCEQRACCTIHNRLHLGARYIKSVVQFISCCCEDFVASVNSILCAKSSVVSVQSGWSSVSNSDDHSSVSNSWNDIHEVIQFRKPRLGYLVHADARANRVAITNVSGHMKKLAAPIGVVCYG